MRPKHVLKHCTQMMQAKYMKNDKNYSCSQMHVQPLTALYFGESSAATDGILLMSSDCLDVGPSGSSSRPFAAPCSPLKVANSPTPPRFLSYPTSGTSDASRWTNRLPRGCRP